MTLLSCFTNACRYLNTIVEEPYFFLLYQSFLNIEHFNTNNQNKLLDDVLQPHIYKKNLTVFRVLRVGILFYPIFRYISGKDLSARVRKTVLFWLRPNISRSMSPFTKNKLPTQSTRRIRTVRISTAN